MSLKTMYITDGSLNFGSRFDDYNMKCKIKAKWQVVNKANCMMCGNLRVTFDNNIAILGDYNSSHTPSYMQISSALALYRTISLFECGLNTSNVDFYKSNWEILLKNKTTGDVLGLGEWKGAFQIFTPFTNMQNINESYKSDVEELLTLLASPTMTIGYDGTIAGTIA